jgi:hypothetical protein
MGSYWSMLTQPQSMQPQKEEFKVLIIGAGIVGLTIAQGCRENGIPFEIFERDQKGERAQGWALTLHWCLRSLERTIGANLTALLPTVINLIFPFSNSLIFYSGCGRFFTQGGRRQFHVPQLCYLRASI